jgi:membrane protein implicated in regulation of membrane protease activity
VTGPATPDISRRVVIPCALFAALDLVAFVVALATGHVLFAVFAAVLFVPFALMAVLGARLARQGRLADTDTDTERGGHA